MGWTYVRCWTLICDRCGDGWQDDAGQPHFDSEAAGLRYARDAGWTLTATGALCRQCTLCEVCSLTGHTWLTWQSAGPYPTACGRSWTGRVRHCSTCGAADWEPPVGPGRVRCSEAM